MSQDRGLQQQRFELKYLIDEALAPSIREHVRSYLELDDYGVGMPNLAYPVQSIYLDSDDLATHKAVVNGTKNRFKLRLRYYDDHPNTPVFLEVKARVNNCILKQRCGVKRDAVELLVAGQLPERQHMLSKEPKHLAALQRFNYLLHHLNAKPKVHNCYLREAWVSPMDNSVRITFDRKVMAEPYFRAKPIVRMENPVEVYPGQTILEIKFTSRFPNWIREMVEIFNLMQFAAAKYSEGIMLIGEHLFHDGDRVLDWQPGVPYPVGAQLAPGEAFAPAEFAYD
jgi:hypothetical protein